MEREAKRDGDKKFSEVTGPDEKNVMSLTTLLKGVPFLVLLLLMTRPVGALTLTGFAENDFPPEACSSDPQDIAFPSSFPTSVSGFDVKEICLLYDQPEDTLFVGMATFDNPTTGQPVPFGDADGDGDPGHTGASLAAAGGTDWPNLGTSEYFALILDFDNDTTTPPDVVAGISAQGSAPTSFKVSEVSLPYLGIDFAFESSFYGSLVTTSLGSHLFANPSAAEPHLEFSIENFSQLHGFSSLDETNPLSRLGLIFKGGSLGDTVLGEEDVRLTLPPATFFDTDSDDIPNQADPDIDNDGIPNSDEPGDSDGDGLPDSHDLDSDNDGISDNNESVQGTNPTVPNTPPISPENELPSVGGEASSSELEQIQGSGPASCALIISTLTPPLSPQGRGSYGLLLGGMFLWFFSCRFLRRFFFKSFFLFLLLILPRGGWALNIEHFRPHFDNLGLIELSTAETLPQGAWSVGSTLVYSHSPLERGLVNSASRVGSVVDYEVNMSLLGAYGITDWVEVGGIIPFFPAMKVDKTNSGVSEGSASFGDLQIVGKFHLWDWQDEQEYLWMGAAVAPFLGFPTGSKSKYTADTNVTGGFMGSYNLFFGKNKFVGNIGLKFREKENLQNLSVGQEMLYGVGYTRPLWEPWDLKVITELDGSFALNGLFSNSNRNPLEWLVGIRKGIYDSKIQIGGGATFGITNGYGVPDFRVFSMISYVAPAPAKEATPSELSSDKTYVRLEGGKIVVLEPIHFETARWIILPDSFPVIQAIADLMRGEPQVRHVVVKGHTDARGSDKSNQILSQRRAQAVVNKLITYGVERDRLSAEGWGESQPIASNRTVAGMAENRRVEFHITEWQKL